MDEKKEIRHIYAGEHYFSGTPDFLLTKLLMSVDPRSFLCAENAPVFGPHGHMVVQVV